jgi:DNA-binding NarL/FixJ family response regulator
MKDNVINELKMEEDVTTTIQVRKIQVIVVDDHRLFRIGLKAAINADYPDIHIAGEAECGKELFGILASTPVDVVLLDINLPDINGAEIARRLRCDYPALKILAVSAENTTETIEAMLEAGIDGFISKQKGDMNELTQAIRTVADGLEYYGRDIAAIIFGVYVSKKKTAKVTNEFTEREREIILACRDGLMCKEIADRMGVSINTINTHKKRIFVKLGINTTMEMVQYALKHGIIRIEN